MDANSFHKGGEIAYCPPTGRSIPVRKTSQEFSNIGAPPRYSSRSRSRMPDERSAPIADPATTVARNGLSRSRTFRKSVRLTGLSRSPVTHARIDHSRGETFISAYRFRIASTIYIASVYRHTPLQIALSPSLSFTSPR